MQVRVGGIVLCQCAKERFCLRILSGLQVELGKLTIDLRITVRWGSAFLVTGLFPVTGLGIGNLQYGNRFLKFALRCQKLSQLQPCPGVAWILLHVPGQPDFSVGIALLLSQQIDQEHHALWVAGLC